MTELQEALTQHLLFTLHNATPDERKRSRWVMHPEWWLEIRQMTDGFGMPLWQPSMHWEDPDLLYGIPVKVTEEAGSPRLEAADV